MYKINNSWVGFLEDIKKLLLILRKNLFPSLNIFFKLPYVGPFSIVAQNRLRKLLKRYCNNLDVKLAFSSFKICNMFSVKDPVPVKLHLNVVYKFTCASCRNYPTPLDTHS